MKHALACLFLVACASAGNSADDDVVDDGEPVDAAPRLDARPIVDVAEPIDVAAPLDVVAPIDVAAIDVAMPIDAKPAPIDAAVVDAMVPPTTGPLFATSQTALYRLDATTLAATSVGNFTGVGGDVVIDLALAPDGTLYGVSSSKLYKINPTTAACTVVGSLAQPFAALAFAGSDLYGATDSGALHRINPASGALTSIGNLGMGGLGDLVNVPGVGLFASLNPGGTNDRLVKVNPCNASTTPVGTSTGFPWVWGLAWTGTRVVAVTLDRKILEISTTTGAATTVGTTGFDGYGAT